MRVGEARGETARRSTKQTPAPNGLPHGPSGPCVCGQPETQTLNHAGGGRIAPARRRDQRLFPAAGGRHPSRRPDRRPLAHTWPPTRRLASGWRVRPAIRPGARSAPDADDHLTALENRWRCRIGAVYQVPGVVGPEVPFCFGWPFARTLFPPCPRLFPVLFHVCGPAPRFVFSVVPSVPSVPRSSPTLSRTMCLYTCARNIRGTLGTLMRLKHLNREQTGNKTGNN